MIQILLDIMVLCNWPDDDWQVWFLVCRWLVYSDPGFQGLLAVLETGEYPFPEDWGFPSPIVGSLRPLRMVRVTRWRCSHISSLHAVCQLTCASFTGPSESREPDCSEGVLDIQCLQYLLKGYGDRDPSSFGLFQAVLYEKAGLEGRCVEVHGDVFSFGRTETDPDDHGLNCVESLKILGGLWVLKKDFLTLSSTNRLIVIQSHFVGCQSKWPQEF